MVEAAQDAGVRTYVGTVTDIPARPAPLLLPAFYEALRAGCSVGESLRRARLALRQAAENPLDGGTLLGLGYILYGDPALACFCAEGRHRLNDAPSLMCEASVEGGFCCKAVCPDDGGYQERRCPEHQKRREEWRHYCYEGHEIVAGVMKLCPGEQNRHAGEKRSICPQDATWMKGLCRECWDAEQVLAKAAGGAPVRALCEP
jgi:hypothetical protein